MTCTLVVDNISVPIRTIKFSDGSTNIKLEVPEHLIKYPPSAYYSISVDPITPANDYLWEIVLIVSAVEETFGSKWNKELLYLPYLPHARADRVFEKGNAFPLKMFFEAVSFMFDEIFLTDPHSNFYLHYTGDAGSPVINIKEQYECFNEVCGRLVKSGDVLIAPDKGSLHKIHKLQQKLDVKSTATFVVEAGKRRDIETGRVIETTLPEGADLAGRVCWIVDDLSDGNGTFIPLAKKIKESGAKQVNMYVTHLIAARGLDNLRGYVDNIYTYQIVGNYVSLKDIEQFNQEI